MLTLKYLTRADAEFDIEQRKRNLKPPYVILGPSVNADGEWVVSISGLDPHATYRLPDSTDDHERVAVCEDGNVFESITTTDGLDLVHNHKVCCSVADYAEAPELLRTFVAWLALQPYPNPGLVRSKLVQLGFVKCK